MQNMDHIYYLYAPQNLLSVVSKRLRIFTLLRRLFGFLKRTVQCHESFYFLSRFNINYADITDAFAVCSHPFQAPWPQIWIRGLQNVKVDEDFDFNTFYWNNISAVNCPASPVIAISILILFHTNGTRFNCTYFATLLQAFTGLRLCFAHWLLDIEYIILAYRV